MAFHILAIRADQADPEADFRVSEKVWLTWRDDNQTLPGGTILVLTVDGTLPTSRVFWINKAAWLGDLFDDEVNELHLENAALLVMDVDGHYAHSDTYHNMVYVAQVREALNVLSTFSGLLDPVREDVLRGMIQAFTTWSPAVLRAAFAAATPGALQELAEKLASQLPPPDPSATLTDLHEVLEEEGRGA